MRVPDAGSGARRSNIIGHGGRKRWMGSEKISSVSWSGVVITHDERESKTLFFFLETTCHTLDPRSPSFKSRLSYGHSVVYKINRTLNKSPTRGLRG